MKGYTAEKMCIFENFNTQVYIFNFNSNLFVSDLFENLLGKNKQMRIFWGKEGKECGWSLITD